MSTPPKIISSEPRSSEKAVRLQCSFSAAELAHVAVALASNRGATPESCFGDPYAVLNAAAQFLADPPQTHKQDANTHLGAMNKKYSFAEAVAINGPLSGDWKSRQAIERALKRWQVKLDGRGKFYIDPARAARILKERKVNGFDIATFKWLLAAEKAGVAPDRLVIDSPKPIPESTAT